MPVRRPPVATPSPAATEIDRFLDLGDLDLSAVGARYLIGGRLPTVVLSILLLHRDRRVDTDVLLAACWGSADPDRRTTLTAIVEHLRSILAPNGPGPISPNIADDGDGYRLVVDPEAVDSCRFELLSAEADRLLTDRQLQLALTRIEDALALWRGRPFADIANLPIATPLIDRLVQLRRRLERDRVICLFTLGHPSSALAALEALLSADPDHHGVWAAQLLVQRLRNPGSAERVDRPSGPGELNRLSRRENDVVNLLLQGLSYAQIARELTVERSTVAFHLSNIYAKTNTSSRHELVNAIRQQT